MSGRTLFKEKQLRLCVVVALSSGTVTVSEAILLPPKPLQLSSSWNCQSGENNDWLCKSEVTASYSRVRTVPEPRRPPKPVQKTVALPVYRPEPSAVMPEREVPAGLPSSDISESAVLIELLNSPGNHYVLQWLAANDRTPLEQLKKRYPVLSQATIAQYHRSGKDWFVLLDGPYQNRGEAMAALSSPPRSEMAKELYPWTRSIASIQRLNLMYPDPGQHQLAQVQEGYDDNRRPLNYEIPAAKPAIAYMDYNQVATSGYTQPYQKENPSQAMLAYEAEGFDDSRYRQHFRSYSEPEPSVLEGDPSTIYASIAQVYDSAPANIVTEPESQARYFELPGDEEAFQPKDYNQHEPEKPAYHWSASDNVLKANPRSYTIVWMSSSKKSSLERAQRRYEEFRDTQVLYYRQFNRDRYVLVSKIFGNRNDAVAALTRPSLSNISSRFAPRVKKIGELQRLTENFRQQIPQTAQVDSYRRKPEIKRSHQPVRKNIAKPAIQKEQRFSPAEPQKTSSSQVVYNAPDNSYTIQWFAANSPEAIEKMKRRFPELASAQTVHFRKNHKDWYVLVQGQYKNSREAIAAIKSPRLKQAMLVLHPWTRPFKSLKKLQIVSR